MSSGVAANFMFEPYYFKQLDKFNTNPFIIQSNLSIADTYGS